MQRLVSRLCVTPVKGMALQHPESVYLDGTGISENRRFHLVDAHGELFSGHELGPLVTIRATWEDGRLTMVFPDGAYVSGDTEDLGESVTTHFFGRKTVSGREVNGPWSGALSEFAGQSLRLVRSDLAGEGPDVHPLSIVSQASVRDLALRSGGLDELDSRRFRINLELEGCQAYEEDSWSLLRVGEAVLRVLGQIPRCRVISQDPATGVKDLDTLAQIAKYRPRIPGDGGLPFGAYARVETPGAARVGDLVEPLR